MPVFVAYISAHATECWRILGAFTEQTTVNTNEPTTFSDTLEIRFKVECGGPMPGTLPRWMTDADVDYLWVKRIWGLDNTLIRANYIGDAEDGYWKMTDGGADFYGEVNCIASYTCPGGTAGGGTQEVEFYPQTTTVTWNVYGGGGGGKPPPI